MPRKRRRRAGSPTHSFHAGAATPQGTWGLITKAAEAADLDPDRISYTQTLRLIRRTATGTAAFPPSPLD